MKENSPPESFSMRPIAHIRSDFKTKFGIPRQSGLVDALQAQVVFEPEFRDPQALRGLEGFSHLWLIWLFSETAQAGWSPTVRPPKLGGNTRMGVFATRSPFRPNPLGLSSVRLEKIDWQTPEGPILQVAGADLMDGTPILDIKPYLPYVDAHPEASGGFALQQKEGALQVNFPPALLEQIPPEQQKGLLAALAQDPRPSYQNIPGRIYGMAFADFNIRFTVEKKLLTVVEVQKSTVKKKKLS
jgi:tRNA-Thr(GGU) m(6)t(6)A37 methyltransferase TsaA